MRTNLAEAESAVDKGIAGSWHWNINIISAQKAVSALTSLIMHSYYDQASRGDNVGVLGGFFECQYMETFKETGEFQALQLASTIGWISYVRQYAHHLFW